MIYLDQHLIILFLTKMRCLRPWWRAVEGGLRCSVRAIELGIPDFYLSYHLATFDVHNKVDFVYGRETRQISNGITANNDDGQCYGV